MKRWLSFPFCFLALAAIMAGAHPAGMFGNAIQLTASAQAAQQRRPNIVLIFPDNLGWGEVGVYGSVRGVPTPRIDRLAAEGMEERVLDSQPVRILCDGDVRPPTASHIATAATTALSSTAATSWRYASPSHSGRGLRLTRPPPGEVWPCLGRHADSEKDDHCHTQHICHSSHGSLRGQS